MIKNKWNHCLLWFQDKCNDYDSCITCTKIIPLDSGETCYICREIRKELIEKRENK